MCPCHRSTVPAQTRIHSEVKPLTAPSYPAARAIVGAVEEHFARHAAIARERGASDLAPPPDPDAIEGIVDAAFWASLRREEGYAPRISLAFVPPVVGRAMTFERPFPLVPDALTKLAPA